MFTKDSRLLTNRLTVPLTSVSKAVGDVFKPTFNQSIKSLFANNEQGFAYDPNDLSTMFQDAAGAVPVTGAGQPVGLMLDKSKGLVLGSDLRGTGAGITTVGVTVQGDHTYRLVSSGEIQSFNYIGIPIGVVEVDYEILGTPTGSLRIDLSTFSTYIPATAGRRKAIIYNTRGSVAFVRSTSPTDVTVKVHSIRIVAGNHAYQTNSASRPILRQNATTGAYYLEFDGSDDFLATSSIDFTATDKISLFAGVRKLADSGQIIAELSANTNLNTGSFDLVAGINVSVIGYTSGSRGTSTAHIDKVARNFTYPAPDVAVLSVKHDISGDLSSMRRNGVIGINGVADKGAGNFGNYPLFIGRRGGLNAPLNGHIYSLIGVGRLATESEIAAIEKELAKRVGVTLSV